MPAPAAGAAQDTVKTAPRAPRLEEATAGQRVVCLMEAAHVVLAPFWGLLWCVERLWVHAPRGRPRRNGWAA